MSAGADSPGSSGSDAWPCDGTGTVLAAVGGPGSVRFGSSCAGIGCTVAAERDAPVSVLVTRRPAIAVADGAGSGLCVDVELGGVVPLRDPRTTPAAEPAVAISHGL